MSAAPHRFTQEVRQSLEILKRIRDEARVQSHLASREVKVRLLALKRRLTRDQRVLRKQLIAATASLRAFRNEVVRTARRTHQA